MGKRQNDVESDSPTKRSKSELDSSHDHTDEEAFAKSESPDDDANVDTPPTESEVEKKPTKKELAKQRAEENRIQREAAKQKKEEERRMKEEQRKRLIEEREERKRLEEEERKEKKRRLEEERLAKRQAQERERELKRQALEEKKRQAAERKKILEEEKKCQAEERKRQAEEKKRQAKEKKRQLEEEKKRKSEEKDRLQKKISSFFTMKKPSPSLAPETQELELEYRKFFGKFNLRDNTTLAPFQAPLESGISRLDEMLRGSNSEDLITECWSTNGTFGLLAPSSFLAPAEAELERSLDRFDDLLKRLGPFKFISFYENPGTPYFGTWCSQLHQKTPPVEDPTTKIEGIDYDYDSELDGEGDAEDVNKELDEEDVDELDDDEDDFIEQDSHQPMLARSLVVITKWRDDDPAFFRDYKINTLVEMADKIDPFAGALMAQEASPTQADTATAKPPTQVSGLIAAPNQLIAKKKVIEDRVIVAKLIKFIEQEQEKNWNVSTLVDLAWHHLNQCVKKPLLKSTVTVVAERKPTWRIKDDALKNYASELASLAESSSQTAESDQ